ncbi:MAG: TetR/AcrR family transcriptional regulator [Acidimicrobiales bacterium]
MNAGATPAGADVPVDPRIEHSRRIICDAALAEFAERGFDGMSIEAVAARAGVGKSTIYRHWSSRAELVDSAIRSISITAGPVDSTTGDDVRSHLIRYLGQLDTMLHTDPWRGVLPAIIHAAERFPEVREIQLRFANEKRAALRSVLQQAIDDHQLAADTDLDVLVRTLVGPLFLGRLMLNEPVGADLITRMVTTLIPPPPLPPPATLES